MGEACGRKRQRASFSQYLICLNPIFLPEWRPDAFRLLQTRAVSLLLWL